MREEILIRTDVKNINYINQIMEGYEYLGVVTTVKDAVGVLRIRTTPDTYEEVRGILENLPILVEYVDYES